MKKKISVLAICAMLFALGFSASAQQPKVPRIAWLTGSTLSSNAHRTEAFRQGLRELGYVEGKNIIIEWRGADGNRDRQSVLVAELVRLKVDVIVTSGGGPTRATKEATATIPIVFAQDTDPIGNGFVASLARPGGNITGLSRLAPELTGKQAFERGGFQALSGGRLCESNQSELLASVKGDQTRRRGVSSEASISGCARSQGF
jgi:putative ABC transport system substrate-binding protein